MDELKVSQRPNYYNNQFLTEVDFNIEQEYHLKRRRLHNRLLHTPGVAYGLKVSVAFAQDPTSVTVTSGVAIDDLGQEIVLTEDKPVDLENYPKGDLHLVITYAQRLTEQAGEGEAAGFTRWFEEPKILAYQPDPDPSKDAAPPHSIVLAIVKRDDTNNVTDVDESLRRAAGTGGGSMNLLQIGLSHNVIKSPGWVHMSLEAANTALIDGRLHVAGVAGEQQPSLTVSGGTGVLVENGLEVTGGPVSFTGATASFADGLEVTGGKVSFAGADAPTFSNGLVINGGSVSFASGAAAPTFEKGIVVKGGSVSFEAGASAPVFGNGFVVNGGGALFAGPGGARFERGLDVTGGNVSFGGGSDAVKFEKGLDVKAGVARFSGGLEVMTGLARFHKNAATPAFENGIAVTEGRTLFQDKAEAPRFDNGLTVFGGKALFGAAALTPSFANGLQVTAGTTSFSGSTFTVNGAALFTAGFEVTGSAANLSSLKVTAGAITPTVGNSEQAGIQFPADPAGGTGDRAFIRYFAESNEDTKLLIGVANEAHDRLSLMQSGAERLTIDSGNVGIKTQLPVRDLHVEGEAYCGGAGAGFSFANRDTPNNGAFVQAPNAGQRWTWFAQGGKAVLRGAASDALSITPGGELKTSAGYICGGHIKLSGGGIIEVNSERGIRSTGRLHIEAGETVCLLPWAEGGAVYIGFTPLPPNTPHLAPQEIDLHVSGFIHAKGPKGGYVVDQFVNLLGEALEQGDVVVVHTNGTNCHYGSRDQIAVPEMDLTEEAYDSRVCGIVDSLLGEVTEVVSNEAGGENAKVFAPRTFDSTERAELDVARVEPGQVGGFVTLGSYRYCKVDADIAPIIPGDLLTTSPTKGHAQKVLERERATGATIGKALGGLEKGKGMIPVLVNIH